MKTFLEHITDAAARGGLNLIFESGMYSLTNDLEQIMKALREAGADFEIVGGVAVNAHIYRKHRSRSFVTRDIDMLVRRQDLQKIAKAAEPLGYAPKKMMGGYTLIRPGQDLAEAIHLLFVGEKSKSTQPFPHPEIHPEEMELVDIRVPVAPLKDLLQMKLSSFRVKDIAHIEILDEVGLITSAVEKQLPSVLQERLKQARQEIAEGKPDVEG